MIRNINKIDFWKIGEKILAIVAIVFSLTMPFTSNADLYQPGCGQLQGVRCDVTGPNDLIIKVINILLGVAALVAVLFLVIGGFRYIVSAGNEKQAGAARNTIVNALIGLVVIILAYVIVTVVNRAVSSTSTSGSLG